MTLNKKHCLILLVVMLVLLLGTSLVSAADTNNTTQVVKDNNQLSTPANYDVDNVVQSDLANVKSDADVEKISNTSKNTNTQTTNKQTENQVTTNDNNIKTININDDIGKTLKGEGELTFTDLANTISQTSAGGVLELLDDYKYVESDSDYKNGIMISQSITINGNNHILDASNLARIFVISGTNKITLNNITFANGNSSECNYNENGGAIYIYNNNVAINNATFINNSAGCDGGAIYWNANNGNLTNTKFINNTASGVLNGSNSHIDDATGKTVYTLYGGGGGAILWTGSNGNITDSYFINNTAYYRGGALLFRPENQHSHCENITIKNSNFTENMAGTNGGAVDWSEGAYNAIIISSNFTSNVANRSAGAIYFAGHQTNVINSTFYNNLATGVHSEDRLPGGVPASEIYPVGPGYGGAILWRGQDGLIDNSTFYNNTANRSGGAVFLIQSDNVTVNNSNFTKNVANENGGAVDFREGATNGRVLNSTFNDNLALRSGGAVFWNGYNGSIMYSYFKNNTANGTDFNTTGGDGGAVLMGGSNATIEYSNFTENHAAYRGGAVFYTRSLQDEITENGTVDSCIFTNNTAGLNGGAVDFFNGSTQGAVINSTFEDNFANRSGGAIYWNGFEGKILDSKFNNNTISGNVNNDPRIANHTTDYERNGLFNYTINGGNGGAVNWIGSNGTINNTNFTNNNATVFGGAIFVLRNENLTIDNSFFENNTAINNGGAVMINQSANYTKILNSNFTDNTVVGYNQSGRFYGDGGAVFFGVDSSYGLIDNSIFINNSANANGGAVVWNGQYGNITSSKFYNNTAPYAAGAVRLNGKYLVVNDSLFDGNLDPMGNYSWGSAIYLTGNNTNITNSNFTNQHGANTGGAIAIDGSNELLENNTFINNSAFIGGAVHLEKNENVTINNSVFTNNNATLTGGAINIDDDANNTQILNSNFTNNKAIGYTVDTRDYGDGGAISFGEGCNAGLIDNSTFTNNSAYANAGAVDWKGNNGVINSSTFTNNTAKWAGGAVRFEGNDGNITSSYFQNNTANSTGAALRLDGNNSFVNDTAFDGNYDSSSTPYAWGLAIYIKGDNANISYSNFTNNHRGDGAGAIYVQGANATIDYSNFENNTISNNGGAIYLNGTNGTILNSNFTNNLANNTGGAIYVNGENGTIDLSKFENNTALKEGGAVYVNGKNAAISNSSYTNNRVIGYKVGSDTFGNGGAVYLNGANGTVSNSNFTENVAGKGGGAVYINGIYGKVSNSNFTLNNATTNGGAVNIKGGNATVEYSIFENNKAASSSGGAIYIYGDSATISYVNMTSNSAGNGNQPGGDIACNGKLLNINYSNFNSSLGSNGGSLYLSGSNNGNITGCNFTNCYAQILGGAISWQKSENIQLRDSYFYNCSCGRIQASTATGDSHHGGAINFQGNTGNLIDNCTFDTCFCEKDGGAFFVSSSSSVGSQLSNCTFMNCYSVFRSGAAICWKDNNGLLINNKFINCSSMSGDRPEYSGQGGAVYFESANNNLIINNNFTNCSALWDGGAIYYRHHSGGCSNNTHINCTFENNFVGRNGGALYLCTSNNTYENCVFINNTANETGGAIYYSYSSTYPQKNGLIVRDCVFSNNTNATNAGFIYISGPNVIITNTTFYNGSASNDGGALYINSISNYNITNITFDYNNASNGGAIYINAPVTLTDINFTNNLAVNGGALYITKDTNLTDCNITNNNATNGSGIYVNGGTVRLTNIRLLDNQAHSANISANKREYVDGDTKHLLGVFLGCDNYLNGIYVLGGNVLAENVLYLGLNGVVNIDTQVPAPTVHLNETYQNVTLEVYDRNNVLKYNMTTRTDEFGNYEFDFPYDPDDSFRLYHLEDDYYTYIVDTFDKLIANLTINVTNITYGEEEIIVIRVNRTSDDDQLPTGSLTVYLNSTLEGFVNQTFEIGDIGDGVVEISTPPLNLLSAADYDVYVRYNGDGRYLSEIATANFTVSKAQSKLDFDVSNYTYNQTGNISFNLTGIEDMPMAGTVLVNITGRESDGTIYSWNDIVLNIQVNGEEVTGNVIELPILNAGEYEVTAFYNESLNYTSNTTVHRFTVNKANPVIDLQAVDTGDEIYRIDVHVEPEVSTSTVRISVVNQTGGVFLDQSYTLDESRISQLLEALPVGTYNVTVNYYGDKNHFEGSNKTQFAVTIDNYPINIQLVNMTYGETQLINITVPAASNPDNLEIKLNDTLLTGYTIDEDGLIQIDTASLTNIVSDGKLVVGTYNLTVSYTADEHFRSNTSSMLFNVTKADPAIVIGVSNISYGQTETVTISTNSYNASGDITVEIINSTGDVIDTRQYTLKSGNPVEFDLTEYEPDTYTVKVTYENDDNYNDRVVSNEFVVRRQVITINELSDIYVTESQMIIGRVTDGYGRSVTEGSVNITLSNGTNITCPLDSTAMYLIEPVFLNNGTYILNASYILNDKIRATSENKMFNVFKIPTITTVNVLNTTIGHVSIDVVVQENVTGRFTNYVQDGFINVTIEGVNGGNPVQYPIMGINTTILLDDIDVVGRVNVNVAFNESNTHLNSTGRNYSDVSQVFTHIIVEPIASNMTINVQPDPVVSGSDVVISGRVYDEAGVEITEGTVDITIGTEEFTEIPVTADGYSKTFTTHIVGIIPVEVHFNGLTDTNDNIKVLESTNNTTFVVEVNKHRTNITIDPLSGIEINKTFTVTINLTNRTGDAIEGKAIKVLINKVEITDLGTTDENGQLIFPYMVHNNGKILIEAEFEEDEEYRGNSTYLLYEDTINLFTSNISASVNSTPIFANESIVISGSLNDSFMNDTYTSIYTHPIADALVTVTINDVIIQTTTDEHGNYSVTLTKDTYPQLLAYSTTEYVVTVEYGGEPGVILGKAASTTYKVDKFATNMTIAPISDVAINQSFPVVITLTNRTGTSIADKDIYVQVNGVPVENLGKTDENGQLIFDYTVHNNNEFIIEAVFSEDELYYGNSTALQYKETIDLLNSSISVEVNNSQLIVNETVKIYGTLNSTLIDAATGNYKPITDVDVIIRIDSVEVATVQTDSNGYYEYTLTATEELAKYLQKKDTSYSVTAIFTGIPGIILGDAENTRYTVSKIATKTNVTIINNTVGNVVIGVNVTNMTGDNVIIGNITVYDMENNPIANQTLIGGVANISIPAARSGQMQIVVTYNENDLYESSNAKNSSIPGLPNEEIMIIDVQNKNVTIDIALSESEIPFDKTTTISGHVIDVDGSEITEGTVTIRVNDEEFTLDLNQSGYSYDYQAKLPGTYLINATFNGISNVTNPVTSENLTLTAVKHDVVLTPIEEITSDNKRVLLVKVDDRNSSKIPSGKLIFTVDSTDVEYDVENGVVLIPIDELEESTTVTLKYVENDLYNEAITQTIVKLDKTNTTVELTLSDDRTTLNVAPEDNVTISVVLKDQYGDIIPNKDVTITITNVDDYNEFVYSEVVHLDENGEGSIIWQPTSEFVYNITATFDGRMDVEYNTASNNSILEVSKIATLGRIFNQTEYHTERFVEFIGLLFYKDKNGNNITIPNEDVNITIFYQNGTSETRTYRTNATGNFEFNFRKEFSHDNFTIGFEYFGSDRYISYDFKKVFDDKILTYSDWVYANRTVRIYQNNLLTFTINDASGTPVNGTFTIFDEEGHVLALVPVKDGVGLYNYSSGREEHVYLTGIFTNDTVEYNRVTESINFYIIRLDDKVTYTVLNNTVYNTTLEVNVEDLENPTNIISEGEVIIYNMTDTLQRGIELGRGNVVDGKAIIQLHDVDVSKNYTIIVTYGGTTTYFANQTVGPLEVLKLDVSLTPDAVNKTAGNVSIKVDVDCLFEENVNNGTVEIYLDDGQTLIGQADVENGEATVNIIEGYLDKPDTYNLVIKYTGSDTFNENSVDYEVTLDKRNSSITANVADNVALNVTLEAYITDAVTGQAVTNGTVSVKANGSDVANVTFNSEDGHVTIVTNITEKGYYTFVVSYEGNDYYLESSTDDDMATKENLTNVEIVGRLADITANATNTTLGNTSIRVNLTDDETNAALPDADVIITLPNGTNLTGKTNSQGIVDIAVDIPVGVNDLIITYPGNDTYNGTNTTLRVIVEQRPSQTSATVINNTIGNVTLNVTVTDKETEAPVTSGAVLVKVNDEIVGVGYIKNGNATIVTDIQEIGEYDIVVEYLGNKNYTESSTVIEDQDVIQMPTITSIEVVNKSIANVTIEVTVTNETGQLVDMGNVTVEFADGTPITLKNLTNGKVNITIPSEDIETLNVKVTYNENDKYLESSATVEISVEKQDAAISIDVDPRELFVDEYVTINVNITDGMGNQITDIDDVDIYINNVAISKDLIEVIDGNFTASIQATANGTFTVNATYHGNDTVNELTSTQVDYVVNKIPTITNVTILNNTYGNVTIRFNVTDARNPEEFATEGLVYVYDFISGNYTSYLYVPGGNIEYKLNYDTAETIKLLVSYSGTDKYLESNARNESAFALDKDVIVIDIQKAPSTTNIEKILSNKSSNVTLAINVTNDTKDLIPTGHVIVFNATDGTILGEGDLTNGKVNITLTDVTEPGDIEVNVTYQGNDKYLPSNATGLNAPVGKENTTVITVTVDPEITIDLNKTAVFVGESVRVSGILYNQTGQAYKADANIKVSINGTDYTATFDSNTGTYYIDYIPEYNGTILINASFIKDDEVVVTSQTIELTVNKIPTSITITPITDVEVNKTFTIEVTLTNNTNDPISGKVVKITVNGVELTGVGVTGADGKTNITYTPHNNTALEIKAVYGGSEVYLASENTTVVDVALSQSVVTANVNKSDLYASESVNISGKVVDGQGNNLVGAEVTIYINGNIATTVTTNASGEYSYVVSNLREGEYTVRAVYDGVANAIIGDEDTTAYSVEKMPTTLDLSVPRTVEVFVPFDIEVTLSNDTDNDNAISGKVVVITVNDVPIRSVPFTDNDGKIVVSYTPQNNSTLVIRATFAGDDYYYPVSATGTVNNIALSESTITVDVNKSSLYASESVNITGKLVDGQNKDITDAVVKLYINNTFEAIVLTNSTGEYSYVIDDLAKGEYTVRAVYEGVNNTIIGDDGTTGYVVNKMNTTITLTVPQNASVNVPFDIEVTLNNNTDNTNAIGGKAVVITVNDVAISNVPLTNASGKVVVSYTPTDNSTLVIKAVFNE
ncbi:MAG: hypothetical protein E7Z86_04000, partial [Methanosphaera stadtmanae]|nr:hypothetical protein [Methanosphaera stadtmanae]